MTKARRILFFVSIVLLTYLLFDSFFRIDFLASMNNASIEARKMELDSIQDIEMLKTEARKSFDLIDKSNRIEGGRAFRTFIILFTVLIIQLLEWRSRKAGAFSLPE